MWLVLNKCWYIICHYLLSVSHSSNIAWQFALMQFKTKPTSSWQYIICSLSASISAQDSFQIPWLTSELVPWEVSCLLKLDLRLCWSDGAERTVDPIISRSFLGELSKDLHLQQQQMQDMIRAVRIRVIYPIGKSLIEIKIKITGQNVCGPILIIKYVIMSSLKAPNYILRVFLLSLQRLTNAPVKISQLNFIISSLKWKTPHVD